MQLYQKRESIGIGSFGQVFLARNKYQDKYYVIKTIGMRQISEKQRQKIDNQVKLLQKLRHPNIVAFKDSFGDRQGNLNIVMVYCQGGDMYNKIKNSKGINFPQEQIMEWIVQMCLALYYIHDLRILHRDLKTQNIFEKNGKIFLGDFGISKVLDSTKGLAYTQIGTPYYMSPQLFKNKPYSYKSDVWALGCVIYQMCNLRIAFDAQNVNALAIKIFKGTYPQLNPIYSQSLKDLVRKMLCINSQQRPTIYDILKKSFIKKRVIKYVSQMLSKNYDYEEAKDLYLDSLKEQAYKLGIIFDPLKMTEMHEIENKNENYPKKNYLKEQASKTNLVKEKLKSQIKKEQTDRKKMQSQLKNLEKWSTRKRMIQYDRNKRLERNRKSIYDGNSKKQVSKSNDKTKSIKQHKKQEKQQFKDHRQIVLQQKQKKRLQQEQKYIIEAKQICSENKANKHLANKKKQNQYLRSQQQIFQNRKIQEQHDMYAQQIYSSESDDKKTIEQLSEQYQDDVEQIEQKKELLKKEIQLKTHKINMLTQKLLTQDLQKINQEDKENKQIGQLLSQQQNNQQNQEIKEKEQDKMNHFQIKINQRIKLLRHRCEAGLGNVLFLKACQKVSKFKDKPQQLRNQLIQILGEHNIGYWHLINQINLHKKILQKKLQKLQ